VSVTAAMLNFHILTILRNGEKGIIHYRGQPIQNLISKSYEDVAHLLIWGALPTVEQRTKLRRDLAKACVAPACVRQIIESFPYAKSPNIPRNSTNGL
jgi:citrate synthase